MKIEFIEDTHTYLADGVIIPSVSQLIQFRFPDAYKGVPEEVLKRKASYGTKVHDYIERFVKGEFTLDELKKRNINPDIKIAVEQFELLRKTWAFHVKTMEEIVCYKGKFAGRYDILTEDDFMVDIKTPADLHEDWLSYQLGLYYLAANIKHDFGFVMWFPKGRMAQVRQINVVPQEELITLVEEYEKTHTPTT